MYIFQTIFLSEVSTKGWMILSGMLILTLWMAVVGLKRLRNLAKTRQLSPKILLKGFREKIWMTLGLGIFFFGLYISLVLFARILLSNQVKAQLFEMIYKAPLKFVQLGFFIFIGISLCIYLVRMLIKYLYKSSAR